jgi:hypothetical protein
VSFSKVLVAHRGDSRRAAPVAAKPERMARAARARDRAAIEVKHVL